MLPPILPASLAEMLPLYPSFKVTPTSLGVKKIFKLAVQAKQVTDDLCNQPKGDCNHYKKQSPKLHNEKLENAKKIVKIVLTNCNINTDLENTNLEK